MAISERDVATRRLRRAEYDRLIDLGMFLGERIELLDGLLVVAEPQNSPHMATVIHVAEMLRAAFGPGWHARVQGPLALDDASEPEPDIAMVRGRPLDYAGEHPATAPLVVEVANSSLRLDRRIKAGLYARAGVPEYWIVNLVEGVLEVHRNPQPAPDQEFGAAYHVVERYDRTMTVVPLAAPEASFTVGSLLPP